jgi:hypothetical protein
MNRILNFSSTLSVIPMSTLRGMEVVSNRAQWGGRRDNGEGGGAENSDSDVVMESSSAWSWSCSWSSSFFCKSGSASTWFGSCGGGGGGNADRDDLGVIVGAALLKLAHWRY